MARRLPERRSSLAVLVVLLAAGLTACGDGGAIDSSVQPLPPRPRPSALPPATAAPPLAAPSGLTPLASPQQLLAAFPIGRPDPFAPLPSAVGAREGAAAPATLPADLRLLGVISGGRSAQVLVQIGSRSGALCPGPRGRCAGGADSLLLPPGWSVERIDAGRGLVVLRQGQQRQVLSLASGL
jgi:hypothetical protein